MTPRTFQCLIATAMAFCIWMHVEPSYAQAPGTHQHSFGGAEQWAHYFDERNSGEPEITRDWHVSQQPLAVNKINLP